MPIIHIAQLEYSYGDRRALSGVSLDVDQGEIFGLLGPNGSGKSTLFRVLSTLLPRQQGIVQVNGFDVSEQSDQVRRCIGVTFQSPSLDLKLTVLENLLHHGRLYGLRGAELRERCQSVMEQLGVADRSRDFAETLSGGLKRRVEIAKTILHAPHVLLLDEPSTGLDPGARHDLWETLQNLRRESRVTILVTTHLMEEADRCDRLGILNQGQLIAQGAPDDLRTGIGGDSVTIQADDLESLAADLRQTLSCEVQIVADGARIEHESGHELVSIIATQFPGRFRSLTLGKPTLEDVFIKLTGHRLIESGDSA